MRRREKFSTYADLAAELNRRAYTIPKPLIPAKHGTDQDIWCWLAAIPGEINRTPVPMLSVHAATEREFRDDPDFDRFQTCIWFQSEREHKTALRIARELAETGVGIVYPSDRNLVIHYGERHQIVVIGGAPERAEDEDAGD